MAWNWILADNYSAVRKSITRGQSAWVREVNSISNSSETTRGEFLRRRVINQKSNINFENWLVGVVDGDGTFHFSVDKNGKWTLHFKVAQSSYNLRLLYYIKFMIGVGQVSVPADGNAEYRVRDVKNIINYIIPIFDKYPLLTSKYYNYELFRQAAFILNDKSISIYERHLLLSDLKIRIRPDNYISPAWSKLHNSVNNLEEANSVVSKSWLVGFTEAEGSFYLVTKSLNRIVHGFEITQKLDKIVLICIKHLLHIKTNVQFKKAGYFSLNTTNSRAIENIISYYKNSMRGMKSVEYRIWSRSYYKNKGDYNALLNIRNNVRIMRNKFKTLNSFKLNK